MIKSTLKLMGRTSEAKGKTVQEAILNLEPTLVRGLGLLTLTDGKKTVEKMIQPRLAQGVWGASSRLVKEIAHKNISLLFPKDLFNEK